LGGVVVTLAADIDLWPTLWAPLLLIVATATLGLLGWTARRFVGRLDDQDAALGLLRGSQVELQVELSKQFGGNSNGLRQAVDRVDSRLTAHLEFHAEHPH
jgi:hypothetical protein